MTYQDLVSAYNTAVRAGEERPFARWVLEERGKDGIHILAEHTRDVQQAQPQRRIYLGRYLTYQLYYIQNRPQAIVHPHPGDRLEWGNTMAWHTASVEEGRLLRAADHPVCTAYRLAQEKGLC